MSTYKCLEILLHSATAPKNCTLADFVVVSSFHEKSQANGEYCRHSRMPFNCCRCGTVNCDVGE